MKRQKNYRQLQRLSSARNRQNEIKSRAVAPGARHSGATVNGANSSLFGEYAEKPAYGEPPEGRFGNTPLPDFQFNWDEEFFGKESSGSKDFTETIPFEIQPAEEVQAATEDVKVKLEDGSGIHREITAVNIPGPAEPIVMATVETGTEKESTVTVVAATMRFVSVKRQLALAAREAEKMRKPAEKVRAGENKPEATKPEVIKKAVVKKADSPAGKKVGSVPYGLPAKFGQNTVINKVERTVANIQKPATGISGTEKKSEVPSLNVRHASSFRSFVISTIHRLMEQQRFLAMERESSTLLARGTGTGKKEETEGSNTSAPESSQGGTTRWNNPLIAPASTGLGHRAGEKGQKRNSSLRGEKQPATRSSSVRAKSKPAPGNYELNAARITLMEARINARAISSNMRIKW